MLRTLKPVEIAEGALLADIAVIYQLLVNYVPFVGDVFRFPIFIVFAILVLRRGLFVSLMSSCVALFLAAILMGPSLVPIFAVEILGGLYLGITMRSRFHHFSLILVGATCGALAFYFLFALLSLLTGVPFSTYVQFLQQTYNAALQFLDVLVLKLDALLHNGIEVSWQQHFVPQLVALGTIAFTYWWLALFILLWGFSLVSTILIYTATNLVVRSLGYEVRPFPTEHFTHRVQRLRRRIFKLFSKRHVFRRPHAEV